MKHFPILLPLLILALILTSCGNSSQEPYEYTSGGATVTVDPVNRTITSGKEVFTYTIEDQGNTDRYHITFPDGSEYYWTAGINGGSGGWSEDFDIGRWNYADFLVDALKAGQPRERTGNVGIGLLLMGLGALNFFLPEIPFYLRYGWAVRDAEPSEGYLFLTKAGGVLAAFAGLVLCVI